MTEPGGSTTWWQRGVVYQVYPRSFQDASGDGAGDLAGVIQRLDYLSDTLGVDAIWLSPFYPSPMADFGYDVSDFQDVDPLFGNLATFDRLVAETHARGLKVIVDYVPNHTSDQHPWFQASRSSRDNSYRDWYVWRDPKPDGSLPNNWLAVFGGSAWEWDATSGQYYLHSYLREQPDLNWWNPDVQAAMLDVLRFWLNRGVDGFRMDALHHIAKDPRLPDNPPNPAARGSMHKAMGDFDSQLHVYDKGHADVHGLLRRMRQVLDAASTPEQPRVAIGEMHIWDPVELASYYGANLDEVHLPFNFGLLGVAWRAGAIRALVDAYEAALPPGAWPNWVLGNHDESRIASRLGPAQARVAAMLLLTLRGTPTLYYGDELGMTDVPVPPERVQDPWGKNVAGLGLGRDPERTPMRWDGSPNAGFCPPGVQPWLPIGKEAVTVNVASELADPWSMLSLTRALLRVRRASPALSIGNYRALAAPEACFVYRRTQGEEQAIVALSFSAEAQTVHLPEGRWRVAVDTHMDRSDQKAGTLELRPHEGCVLLPAR